MNPALGGRFQFSEEEFATDPRDEAINALNELENQKSPEKAKEILEQIKTSEEVAFQQNETEFIFTVDMWFDSNLIYTFNKETYKLEKT